MWKRFARKFVSSSDVGIWHETFMVADGQYRTLYRNVPAMRLGAASQLDPVANRLAGMQKTA